MGRLGAITPSLPFALWGNAEEDDTGILEVKILDTDNVP